MLTILILGIVFLLKTRIRAAVVNKVGFVVYRGVVFLENCFELYKGSILEIENRVVFYPNLRLIISRI